MSTREAIIENLIEIHPDTSREIAHPVTLMADNGYQYLVARNAKNEGVFLAWNGTDPNVDLTEEVYEAITEEARAAGLATTYHVYSRLSLLVTDDVAWHQLPASITAEIEAAMTDEYRAPQGTTPQEEDPASFAYLVQEARSRLASYLQDPDFDKYEDLKGAVSEIAEDLVFSTIEEEGLEITDFLESDPWISSSEVCDCSRFEPTPSGIMEGALIEAIETTLIKENTAT